MSNGVMNYIQSRVLDYCIKTAESDKWLPGTDIGMSSQSGWRVCPHPYSCPAATLQTALLYFKRYSTIRFTKHNHSVAFIHSTANQRVLKTQPISRHSVPTWVLYLHKAAALSVFSSSSLPFFGNGIAFVWQNEYLWIEKKVWWKRPLWSMICYHFVPKKEPSAHSRLKFVY